MAKSAMEKPLWPIQNLWPLGAHLHKQHVTTNRSTLSEERTSSRLSVGLLILSHLSQLSCRTRSKKCIRVKSKSSHFDSFPLKMWPMYSNSLSGAAISILPGKLHTTLQSLKNWNKKNSTTSFNEELEALKWPQLRRLYHITVIWCRLNLES